MRELATWKQFHDIKLEQWQNLSCQERIEAQCENPNFVIFDDYDKRQIIGRLKPEHCSIDYLWEKYKIITQKCDRTILAFNNFTDGLLASADFVVIHAYGADKLVFLIGRNADGTHVSYDVLEEFDVLDEAQMPDEAIKISKKLTYLYDRRDWLMRIIADMEDKISRLVAAATRKKFRNRPGQLFYVEACGDKLMFLSTDGRSDIGVEFLGKLSDNMRVKT